MRLGVIYTILSIITLLLLGGVAAAVAIHFTKDKPSSPSSPPLSRQPTSMDVSTGIVKHIEPTCYIPESGTGKYYIPVPCNRQ
jgi:hypothetical protein